MNKQPIITKDPRKRLPWIVRWHGEYDPATGKQKRYSKAFRIQRQAEAFRSQKLLDFNKGSRRDAPEKMTLGRFCQKFLETKKSMKESTREVWQNECNRLLDYFGADKPLRSIKPMDASPFLNAQKNRCPNHKRNGDGLAAFTVEKLKRNTRGIFKQAVEWELIIANPFGKMQYKKPPSKRWYRLRPAEYLQLLEAAPDLRTRTLYAVLYTAGLRSGEAAALTWNDVDFERNLLTVNNRKATDTLPPFTVKTYESRTIPLPRQTVDLLVLLHSQAAEGNPYLFLSGDRLHRVKARWQQCRAAGKQWRNSYMMNNVLDCFKRDAKRAGIKPEGASFTLHTLRKNCIQNWADCLPINVTRQLAGHATTETTLMYYSQVDNYHIDLAMSAIETLIDSGNTTGGVDSTPKVRPDCSLSEK